MVFVDSEFPASARSLYTKLGHRPTGKKVASWRRPSQFVVAAGKARGLDCQVEDVKVRGEITAARPCRALPGVPWVVLTRAPSRYAFPTRYTCPSPRQLLLRPICGADHSSLWTAWRPAM